MSHLGLITETNVEAIASEFRQLLLDQLVTVVDGFMNPARPRIDTGRVTGVDVISVSGSSRDKKIAVQVEVLGYSGYTILFETRKTLLTKVDREAVAISWLGLPGSSTIFQIGH